MAAGAGTRTKADLRLMDEGWESCDWIRARFGFGVDVRLCVVWKVEVNVRKRC